MALAVATARAEPVTVVDDFERIDGWSATASAGAQVWIAQEPGRTGMGLRIDYDLGNGQGYVIVRREVSLSLPKNFAFTFDLFGEGLPNNLEFKLVEPDARTVWWWRQRDVIWPTGWQTMTVRKSRFDMAWGTTSSTLSKIAAIEFAITPGEGGSGSVWIDELVLEPRPIAASSGPAPTATATTTLEGQEPDRMLDGDGTGWHSAALPEQQEVLLDFEEAREYGGLTINWNDDDYATAFDVLTSSDGERWATPHSTEHGRGGRDYLYLPDSESRYLKLRLRRSSRGQGYGIRTLRVEPIAFSASPNYFFEHVARDSPRGEFPRYFVGEQSYWTVVGVEGDGKEALVNEDGALEIDRGAFSIEPFLWLDGRLVTWADVESTQALEDGYLPMPTITWRHDAAKLRISVFAAGESGKSFVYGRYRVENPTGRRLKGRLFLAIRPFQVLPPWQALNMLGGVAPIREIRYENGVVRVNRDKAVVVLTPPDEFGASTFEEAEAAEVLRGGRVPEAVEVSDPSGFGSGVLAWDFDLAPDDGTEVLVAIPFHEPYVETLVSVGRRARALVNGQQQATKRHWQTVLSRVEIDLPAAPALVQTLKASLGYVLINRDGPALHPGSRNYARSWIRDGAVTSSALLEMGFPAEVSEFVRWYAARQFPDGKIPCCIDRRGPDSTPEHDSNGEFLALVAEYYRYTRDVGLVSDLWTNVVAAVDYLAALRTRRTVDTYRQPELAAYFGLLPESISHEGYSSRPVHAYWDDFWALAGLRAAPSLASVMGDFDRVDSFTALRDAFQTDLVASIPKAMAMHGIDYVPGAVELGDFDPTSTAVGVGLLADEPSLRPAFERTFQRYLSEIAERRAGTRDWTAYSPYELRNVEALLALGHRGPALALLDWLVADQRPAPWREWAEVSWRDVRAPRFIGDMPHTWIASIFVHVLRTLLVWERGRSLVIGGGVPEAWVERGITVRRMPTAYGVVNFTLRTDGPNAVRLRLAGDLAVPPDGIVFPSPLPRTIEKVTIDGRPVTSFTPEGIVVDHCPADVVIRYK